MTIKVSKGDLEAASRKGILPIDKVDSLWGFLEERKGGNATLTLSTAITYLGGGLVFIALGWFGIRNYEYITALQIATGLTVFAVLTLVMAHRTAEKGARIQSSVFATMAIMATPMLVIALQSHYNFWPSISSVSSGGSDTVRDFNRYIDPRWLTVELATLAIASAVFAWHRSPYILFPVTIVFYWMVMDFTMYQVHAAQKTNLEYEMFDKAFKWNSVYFGVAAMAVAGIVDWFRTTRTDLAYWIYTAGVACFWGGLVSMGESGDLAALMFCLINVALFVIGGILQRGIFIAAGVLGIAMYVWRLVEKTFAHDPLFALYIGLVGVALVVGVVLTRPLQRMVMAYLHELAPERLRHRAEA